MATALGGTQIADTYPGLIKTCDSCTVGGSIQLSDGDGCVTSLFINTAGNGIIACGNSSVNGDLNVSNNLNVTSDVVVGGNLILDGNSICDSSSSKITFNTNCIINKCNTLVCGELSATGDIVAFCTSDKRLKDNLKTIDNSQIIINSLTGYNFDWNVESNKSGNDIGVIAQDVQKVIPNAVQERDNGFLAVDYVKVIPVLIEEVKRLNNEIIELKKKVN